MNKIYSQNIINIINIKIACIRFLYFKFNRLLIVSPERHPSSLYTYVTSIYKIKMSQYRYENIRINLRLKIILELH